MNLNRTFLAGNLTRDCELRYSPKGTAIAKFGLAVNRRWKDADGNAKDDVLFIDVDAFGKTAETVAKYFKKGSRIFVEGRLKLDTWEKDGKKNSRIGVVLENFQFVDSKRDDSDAPPQREQAPAPAPAPDDDVPF